MTSGPAVTSGDAEALTSLEAQRCAAISCGDVDRLRDLLADDYLHVHMTGRVDDRDGHLRAVASRPRRTERGPLLVRVYGDLAVITGDLTNHMATSDGEPTAVRACCHQVAVRHGDRWRFVATQLTPMAAPKAAR